LEIKMMVCNTFLVQIVKRQQILAHTFLLTTTVELSGK